MIGSEVTVLTLHLSCSLTREYRVTWDAGASTTAKLILIPLQGPECRPGIDGVGTNPLQCCAISFFKSVMTASSCFRSRRSSSSR